MCRKNKNQKRCNTIGSRRNSPQYIDDNVLIQKLRIRIWQIIARNNADELVDPLLRPLKNPAPYIQNLKEKKEQKTSTATVKPIERVEDIKPTLDEIMPLPKKDEPKATPKTAKKKTSAKALLSDNDSDELEGQMTIDEAIAQADIEATTQAATTAPAQPAQQQAAQPTSKQQHDKEQNEEQDEEPKLTLRERYITWKMERADRKDYFNSLEVQIQNKNAACFEILDYLDKLQNED